MVQRKLKFMKIKKYKDLQKWTDGPNKDDGKLDQEIEDFISNFRNSLDDSVSNWISGICQKTKLKEYKDCDIENSKPEKILNFIKKKGFKKYKHKQKIRLKKFNAPRIKPN